VQGPRAIGRICASDIGRPPEFQYDILSRELCGKRHTMPLQNRVTPFAELVADPARGTLFGNRGGKFHRDDRTLGRRRWASRQWICCVLDFKGRQRDVWGRYYTELFFLDEPTALAAGHRPCFECRRLEAIAFAGYWQRATGLKVPPRAPAMDAVLHAQRLDGSAKRLHRRPANELPDGTVIARGEHAFALRAGSLLRWSASGYRERVARPRRGEVDILTPPAIVAVLAAGYQPRWHASAS
jgi:hypothetical protein